MWLIFALLTTVALAMDGVVLHDATHEPETSSLVWSTTWVVTPPPERVIFAVPLPADTVALEPTRESQLVRTPDGHVASLRRSGRRVRLRVPHAHEGVLLAPLWAGDLPQRVTLDGVGFVPDHLVPIDDQRFRDPALGDAEVRALDRAGGPVTGGGALYVVAGDAVLRDAGIMGSWSRGFSWTTVLGWMAVAALASLVAGGFRRPRRTERRPSAYQPLQRSQRSTTSDLPSITQ